MNRQLRKIISLCSVFIFLGMVTFAQQDTVKQKSDSINDAILKEYNKKLEEIEHQRVEDSIAKANLTTQLNALKTTDNLKKEELQKQLQALHDKEVESLAQKKAQIDELRHTAIGYPVTGFFKDTLFLIYSRLGSFTAADRAAAITQRIHNLAGNFSFRQDSLKISQSDGSDDLTFGDRIIMSVSENDGIWENETTDSLAKKYKRVIGEEVMKYKSATSFATLSKEIALALLVLLIIIAVIRYTGRLFRWTAKKIREQENKLIRGIKIKNYTLFDARRQVNLLLNVNVVLKWLIIILIIYVSLPVLFGIFPWTKNFANTLFGYILNPIKKIASGLWHYLPSLFAIAVIIIIFRYLLKGIRFLKSEIEKNNLKIAGFYPDWANPTYQIIRVLVFAFMLILIYPYLPGSNSPVFRGVSVFLGALFTFGSASSLSNVISGLILTYMRLFKIGDRVKIGDVTGDIIEKSLLVTRIRTIKNEIISIPNSTVMNSHTVNYSSDAPGRGLIIHTTVTIGYDVPWRDMHKALIDAALKTDLVLKEPAPFVLQTSLDDFYVSYQINAYIRVASEQATIYSNLHQNIQDICNERGIEILSPHYLYARDGNATTIPSDYLPKDYKAPDFNIRVKKEQ
jgi:small-conductance mechanosensitive channel